VKDFMKEGNRMRDWYSQVFLESMHKVSNESSDKNDTIELRWKEIREFWTDHYAKIPDELIRQRTRLLMAIRYTECLQSIFWIEWLSMRGGYYQAIRELKSILESTIQAYYVDKEYQEIDVEGKLAVIREMTSSGSHYGNKLIDKARLSHIENIKILYKQLSQYVHPTTESLHRILSAPDVDTRIVNLTVP
jgi:hypothetical protein